MAGTEVKVMHFCHALMTRCQMITGYLLAQCLHLCTSNMYGAKMISLSSANLGCL